jgi:hypothetical protein
MCACVNMARCAWHGNIGAALCRVSTARQNCIVQVAATAHMCSGSLQAQLVALMALSHCCCWVNNAKQGELVNLLSAPLTSIVLLPAAA